MIFLTRVDFFINFFFAFFYVTAEAATNERNEGNFLGCESYQCQSDLRSIGETFLFTFMHEKQDGKAVIKAAAWQPWLALRLLQKHYQLFNSYNAVK